MGVDHSSQENCEQLNILMVSHLFPPETGGVQRVAEKLATQSSHNITVLASPSDDSSWDDRYAFDVHRFPLTGVRGLITQVFLVFWFTRSHDLVYYTRPEYAFLALPARLLGCPVVSHAHGSELFSNGRLLHKIYLYLSLRVTTHFVAISDWTKERLSTLGVPDSSITIVPNGVDFEHYSNSNPERPDWLSENLQIILTVGRIIPRKGQQIVVKSLSLLDDENIQYLVVGPGDYGELSEIADEYSVSDQVHFLGKVSEDELLNYYSIADVFVMPSLFVEGDVESFGLVYLEANAAGTPVIGSRNGGIPSAIKHRETGLLCEPSAESVASSIKDILSSEEMKDRLSENGIEWARRHSWNAVGETWDCLLFDVYEQY